MEEEGGRGGGRGESKEKNMREWASLGYGRRRRKRWKGSVWKTVTRYRFSSSQPEVLLRLTRSMVCKFEDQLGETLKQKELTCSGTKERRGWNCVVFCVAGRKEGGKEGRKDCIVLCCVVLCCVFFSLSTAWLPHKLKDKTKTSRKREKRWECESWGDACSVWGLGNA